MATIGMMYFDPDGGLALRWESQKVKGPPRPHNYPLLDTATPQIPTI